MAGKPPPKNDENPLLSILGKRGDADVNTGEVVGAINAQTSSLSAELGGEYSEFKKFRFKL